MWIPAAVLVIGLLAVIFATEGYGLRFGGVVVVPLLAMYVMFDFRTLPLFVISTAAAYVVLLIIDRHFVLYGRRLLLIAIVAGALIPVISVIAAQFAFGNSLLPVWDIAYIGSILPGIAAYNLRRLDQHERVADVVGSLALVVGLVMLAAFFLLLRSAMAGTPTIEAILATAGGLVFGEIGLRLAEPADVLPRTIIVGLFVVGLLLNESLRKRYGIRLAGIIVIPLLTVFTLHDVRLLGVFIVATATGLVFIRLIHRQTFLYGRNLLAGACIIGVLISALAIPFLPESVGLRPLIVGILAGVASYNGHVQAPGERVRTVLVSTGAFVALYALADGLAFVLDSPFRRPISLWAVAIGVVLMAAAGYAVYRFEKTRPSEPISTVTTGVESAVPDGGVPPHQGDLLADGGADDPLRGRRKTRLGPNAYRVCRDREPG